MNRYFLILLLACVNGTEIIIDPAIGHNDNSCLEGKAHCKDFDYVFTKGVNYLNDAMVVLYPSTHNIVRHIQIRSIRNLTIKSLNESNAVLRCLGQGNGVTFIRSKSILFENVTIENCGARHISTEKYSNNNTSSNDSYVYIAICFICCRNISIRYSNFINNYGRALSFYNVNKAINVFYSVFKNNSNRNFRIESAKFISGGGIYIEYTRFNTTEKYTCHEFPNYNKNTWINIFNSTFEDNVAENRYNNKLEIANKKLFTLYRTFGCGGGVCINMFGNATKNAVSVNSCRFIKNMANWGAGFSATFKDKADENILGIDNSSFSENNATYAGGGVRIESIFNESIYYNNKTSSYHGNVVSLIKISYFKNSAILGGGLSILATTRVSYIYNGLERYLAVLNNSFSSNTATIGFAIGLNTINMNDNIIGPGMSIKTILENCNFYANHFEATENSKVIGQGTIYSDQFSLIFLGENKLYNNNFTAVVLDSSSLLFAFESVTSFINNTGLRGGAIAMYGLSWLMFGQHSEVLFKSNWVSDQGGAIYVEPGLPPRLAFKTTLLSTKQCFFRYECDVELDNCLINVTFDNNFSIQNSSGNSIYALTLQHCRSGKSSILHWKPFTFLNNPNNQSEIVTSAVEIALTEGSLTPYPNLPYSPDVTIIDEMKQHVYATMELEVKSINSSQSSQNIHVFHMKDHIPNLRILRKVHSNFTYQFRSMNGLLFQSKLSNGFMKQCPPGYRPNENRDSCICMDAENGDVLKCFEENSTVLILNKKWGYLDNDNLLKLINCPLHFCKCNGGNRDFYKCELNSTDQCIKNRNGTLCGKCKDGKSVQLGNEDCDNCGNTNLYIALVVICVGIPAFVVCLLILNCDAISGHLDAYLFSNQMFSIILTESIKLDPVSGFVIGVTSFTGTGGLFGICLYDGMDNFQKLGLNYVLPTSIILFTWIIAKIAPAQIWVFNYRCGGRQNKSSNQERRRKNFGRALSFVSVLCYSSITNTSFRIIQFVEIQGVYYVYNAPEKVYLSFHHSILMAIACILVVLISIGFPLMLCFEETLSRTFRFFVYFSPIATALKSYYKENCKNFAAFYFLFRFLILLFDVVLLYDIVLKLIIFTSSFVVLLTVFTTVQPYRLLIHNILDVIIIANLTILSLLSIIVNIPFALKDSVRKYLCTICKVFVWLPLIITIIRFIITYKRQRQENNNRQRGGKDSNYFFKRSLCFLKIIFFTCSPLLGLVSYIPVRGEDNVAADN